jgi:aminopeptidase
LRPLGTEETRAEKLNNCHFKTLKYKSSKTDLTLELPEGHIWLSGASKDPNGIDFNANIPTEEVFTAPHRLKVDGVVRSALPLIYNGDIVDNFTLEFRKGKVVSFSAEKGYEVLKQLLQLDKGTTRIGEVALIGKNSPIAKSKILFYNTLFDENASCHLAIGKGYPTTVKNGNELTDKELKQKGLNDSNQHVDFMIGTDDLTVTGIKKDGSKVLLFNDGDWVI